jgi:hypothetical protein
MSRNVVILHPRYRQKRQCTITKYVRLFSNIKQIANTIDCCYLATLTLPPSFGWLLRSSLNIAAAALI